MASANIWLVNELYACDVCTCHDLCARTPCTRGGLKTPDTLCGHSCDLRPSALHMPRRNASCAFEIYISPDPCFRSNPTQIKQCRLHYRRLWLWHPGRPPWGHPMGVYWRIVWAPWPPPHGDIPWYVCGYKKSLAFFEIEGSHETQSKNLIDQPYTRPGPCFRFSGKSLRTPMQHSSPCCTMLWEVTLYSIDHQGLY